jgi:hypothetical protein
MTSSSLRLEHFYHGKLVEEGRTIGGFGVTAHSTGLPADQASAYFTRANLGSFSGIGIDKLVYGVGFVQAGEDNYLLTHVYPARHRDRGHPYPDYHCIILPASVVEGLRGAIFSLITTVLPRDRDKQPFFDRIADSLEPVIRPLPPLPTRDQELELLLELYGMVSEAEKISQIVSSLLGKHELVVDEAPLTSLEGSARLRLAQALTYLLPPSARHHLTFATEVFDGAAFHARLKMLYASPYAKHSMADYRYTWNQRVDYEAHPRHLYANQVGYFWEQAAVTGPDAALRDLLNFIHASIEPRHAANRAGRTIPTALGVAAESVALADAIERGEPDAGLLLQGLLDDRSLSPEQRIHYRSELIRCAERGQAETVALTLLDPAYTPADMEAWQDVLTAVFKRHVDGLIKQDPSLADLASFFTEIYGRLEHGGEAYVRRVETLHRIHTISGWQAVCGPSDRALMALIRLLLTVGEIDQGLVMLDSITTDRIESTPWLVRDVGRQVYDVVQGQGWQGTLSNRQLAKLWAAGGIDLGEEEFFYLLLAVTDRRVQTALLERVFVDILAKHDNAERARLLLKAAECLAPG